MRHIPKKILVMSCFIPFYAVSVTTTGISLTGSVINVDASVYPILYGFSGGTVSIGDDAKLLFDDQVSSTDVIYYMNSNITMSGNGYMEGNENVPLYLGYKEDAQGTGAQYSVDMDGTSTISFTGNQPIYIGYDQGFSYVLNAKGSSSLLTDDMYLGYQGYGEINLGESANLTANNLYLAQEEGSEGVLNIDTANLDNFNVLNIQGGEGTAVVNFYNTDDVSLKSNVTGSVSLNKYNSNTLLLADGWDYSYTGETSLYGGTIKAGKVDAISASKGLYIASEGIFDLGGYNQKINALSGSGKVYLGNNTLDEYNLADSSTMFSGVISGTGEVNKSGDGTLVLTGDNTYTGDTTISSGTLQLGDGGTSGSIAGNVINNSALVFNRSNELTYSGTITGTGSVAQAGTGTTILTGDNPIAVAPLSAVAPYS